MRKPKILSLDWDKIEQTEDYTTWRSPVLGGWFVHFYGPDNQFSAIFYPDPQHEWDGKSLSIEDTTPPPTAGAGAGADAP